ncbi:MAG: hypothetical protein JSV80_09870, partial [Acidobacteriota bacterium]
AQVSAYRNGNGHGHHNYFDLNGSADWEFYRSDSSNQGVDASYDSLRERYSLDMSGSIWDYRFLRYTLGLDFYRIDRDVNGEGLDSEAIGYRATTMFFPNRRFPLRLYARRTTTDVAGTALANSDRETSSWGAEWNVALGQHQDVRLLYDRSTYDLTSPVVLEEERTTGLVDYRRRGEQNELEVRYSYSDQDELVGGSAFTRHDATVSHRTRFVQGSTLLLNAHHTASDARFTSGQTDDLTVNRAVAVLDLPRDRRLMWSFSYQYNDNDGRFVDSTSHDGRTRARVRLSDDWETTGTILFGTLDSRSGAIERGQELVGGQVGARYGHDWTSFRLTASANAGVAETTFDTEPDRRVTNLSAGVDMGMPVSRDAEVLASLWRREDETDATGVGYTYDETRASIGWRGRIASWFRTRTEIYLRDTVRDTFDFGVQDSREIGVEGSLTAPSGGVSVTLSTSDGITDFLPDPGAGGPFLPGPDLVNKADVASLALQWRLPHRLRLQMQGRLEQREFSSIGEEEIISYYPRLDWSYRLWTMSIGFSHYERNNDTTFSDDTWLIKISRKFL